jgi:hypothetical protein
VAAIAVGQIIASAWALYNAIVGVGFFLLLGGFEHWGNWSGEWAGWGAFLSLFSFLAVVIGPPIAICRIVTAIGLFRRRRWARRLAIGLAAWGLIQSGLAAITMPSILIFLLSSLILDIFTLSILLQKRYADEFPNSTPVKAEEVPGTSKRSG